MHGVHDVKYLACCRLEWVHIGYTENFRNLSQQNVLILHLQHFEEAFQEEKLRALEDVASCANDDGGGAYHRTAH